MRDVLYKFCFLSRKVAEGIATTRSWLPVRYAVPGKYLELLNGNDEWENGWHVESAGEPATEERFINKRPAFGSLDDKARSRKIGV